MIVDMYPSILTILFSKHSINPIRLTTKGE